MQKQELIGYCEYVLGIKDYVVFEDAGYSGKNTDRPGFQKMMAQVRNGLFSHVVVWKIDRISRNLLDFATMYEELKRLGVTFVSKNEQFDTSSAMGEAMLQKLRQRELVSWATVEKLCELLNCQVGDLIEYVKEEEPKEE